MVKLLCLSDFEQELLGYDLEYSNPRIKYGTDEVLLADIVVGEYNATIEYHAFTKNPINHYWRISIFNTGWVKDTLEDIIKLIPELVLEYKSWSESIELPTDYDWKEGLCHYYDKDILVITQKVSKVVIRKKDGTREVRTYIENITPEDLDDLEKSATLV